MEKIAFLLVIFFAASTVVFAQNKYTDSIEHQLAIVKQDTNRVLVMSDLCYFFRYTNIDSSLFYGNKALALATQLKFVRGESVALNKLGLIYREKGDLPKSLELQFKSLKIAQDNNYQLEVSNCLIRIGLVYMDLKEYQKAINYYLKALKIDLLIKDKRTETMEYMDLGMTYQYMNNPDSALYYGLKADEYSSNIVDLKADVYRILGNIEAMKNNKTNASAYYLKGIQYGLSINDFRTISYIYSQWASMYKHFNQPDSAIYCATNGVKYGQITSYKNGIYLSSKLLAELYDPKNPAQALNYYKIADAAKDSLFGAGNIKTIQTLIARENERQRETEAAKAAFQHKLKMYGLLASLGSILIVALILYRNNAQKKKANKILENTLRDLKAAQSQLVQREKMASLGELTAGIAHEIQNPLNFVNNFSEVGQELMIELKEELDKGDTEEAKAIADDMIQNLEKIHHHGKRADNIVKGMLEHSRIGKGEKHLTNINVLADEFFKLSYHGLQAKDKNFNAEMITHFEETLPKIEVVQQDIGRVLLNLFNNAFYAVNEKKKTAGSGYRPTVELTTFAPPSGGWGVTVRDNGNGIPEAIKDKIMQPFFTTKPTGEGTGLGLSLSYDIVVKGHGGSITVETKEGEFSEFIITFKI